MKSEEPSSQPARTRVANVPNPSADELKAARAAHWRQDGNPLLSLEQMRQWLQRSGLALYGAKPQLGAPAPSLLEATLGKAAATPEPGELDTARGLLARLVAEGSAVPLNLLGLTGGTGTDVPDFVVSAAVFSYIFTLRGNKAWKQAPVTAGAVKVSPLALAAYEMLAAKVTLSAYDLATQLGKEVTEAAVLRALTELWSQLRVLPVPQQDGAGSGAGTLWELASGRFTKQIKAGANAGQPSALSALISLYLGQAIVATEDEIESFLSPLAPRSRLREVIHALLSARQLETLVIDGKTLLHVAGELPAFAAVVPAETGEEPVGELAPANGDDSGSRISKLAAKPGSKIGTGLRAKPAYGKPAYGSKPEFGKKPGFGAKPGFGRPTGGDRERRPFRKESSSRPEFERPAFDKPWQEDRPARPAAAAGNNSEFKPAARALKRPSGPGESRPLRREYKPRAEGEAPRRTFSKPGTFARKREGFAAKSSFDRSESRPPRRDFAASGERSDRSERPAAGGFKRPGSYTPRPAGGFGGERADKSAYGAKPGFLRDRPDRGESAEAPRKVFRKFDAPRSPKPFAGKPSSGARPGPASSARPFEGERPKRSFDGPRPERTERPGPKRTERPDRSESRPRPSFAAKPGGSAGKKPYSKPGGFAKTGGPFAKFADGKKPFRKPGAPKKAAGGFGPTKRKRDEGGK